MTPEDARGELLADLGQLPPMQLPAIQFPPIQLPAIQRASLPLWFQVAQSLRAYSASQPRGGRTRLPTEVALSRHFGVSVSTVRQALSLLEGEGVVSRHRRRGTFVNAAAPGARSLQVRGSLDSVVRQQQASDTVVLGRSTEPVPGQLAEHFADVTEVVRIARLRSDGGSPLSYAENFLRPELAARVDDERLLVAPMTQLLRDDLGLRLAHIENIVEARAATPRIAQLLDIELLSPVLLSTNLTRDGDGVVVDAALIYYRGDRFAFSVQIDVS
jgi:GntR family transcriptional regulator